MYSQWFQYRLLLKLVLVIGFISFSFVENFAQSKMADKLEKHITYAEKNYPKKPEKTLNKLENALQQMQEANYLIGEWKIQNLIASMYFEENQFDKTIEAHQKNIKVAEAMDSIFYKGRSYHSLGDVYMRIGRLDKAEKVSKIAKQIFAKANRKQWEANGWGSLGNVYTQLGRAEEGLNAYRTAYAIYDSLGIDERVMAMNLNIGYFYLMQGDGKTALSYVKKGLEHDLKHGKTKSIAMGYGNLAYANSLMGNYADAFKNYQHSVDTARKYNLKQVEYTTYKDMSETYSKSGNYKKSLEYLNKYYALKDSIIGAKAQQKINDLEVQFVTQEKDNENIALKQEKQLQRFQIWGLIIGFVLLGIIAVLVIQRMYGNIRKKQELIDKNTEIHRLEKQLIENQLIQKKLEQEKTLEDLRYKNQRLTDFALDITQKNKIAETLNADLDKIEDMKIPKAARDKLRNLRHFIDTNLQINEEVTAFEENFDMVLVEFNQKLKREFSNLTKKDMILCGFLRLGLQNKEIATIRNVSPNAVKMARYRLRKKLNLVAEDDIEAFLKGI